MEQPKYGAMASSIGTMATDEPVYVDNTSPFDPPPPTPYESVPGDTGGGVLGRSTKFIFWLAAITLLLALTALPAILIGFFLVPEAANFPLFLLAMLPVGPAISAALYAVRARYRSEDAGPWRAFWRGYRLNFAAALRIWVPALLVLGIIGYTLLFGYLIGLTTAYRIGLAIIGLVVLALAMHALSIVSFFTFRFSDTLRIAWQQLWKHKASTFGLIALAVIAFGVSWWLNEWVLLLVGGILTYFWYLQARPVLKDTQQRFTKITAEHHNS